MYDQRLPRSEVSECNGRAIATGGPLNRMPDRDAGVFDSWDETPGCVVESGMESSWITLVP
jgi:hypothetical protein